MELMSLDLLMWTSEAYRCTGRLALSAKGCEKLAASLRSKEPTSAHWHCDEDFLSQWLSGERIRTLLALDLPHHKESKAGEFVDFLMERGDHTVLVKDRDDSKDGEG
jgi:hypothetical protein